MTTLANGTAPTPFDILSPYVGVLVVAFLVTLIATPIMRRFAVANGVVDWPGPEA